MILKSIQRKTKYSFTNIHKILNNHNNLLILNKYKYSFNANTSKQFTVQNLNTISNTQFRLQYLNENIIPLKNIVQSIINYHKNKHNHHNQISKLFSLQYKSYLNNNYKNFIQKLKISQNQKIFQNAEKQFKNAQLELKTLYQYIKTDIIADQEINHSTFKEQIQYYFHKQGKKVRPILIYLLASTFNRNINQTNMKLENLPYIRKWAALMEVMHIASLAHDDIIDDSSSRRGQQTHHIKYGKRNAVFSGNFIISKASKAIYEFNNPDLFRIYSIAMDDLAGGQIIQILTKNSIGKFKYDKQNKSENKSLDAKINKVIQALQIYVHKSYYKTAALMSNALRAVPLFFSLSDFDETTRKQIQILCFRVGQHFGIGFQIVDDILDYTSTTQQMGKQAMSDLVGGNITGPVYLSLLSEYLMKKQDLKNLQNNANELLSVEKIEEILLKKKKNIEQVMKIKQWVIQRGGVQSSIQLAVQHIKKGLQYVQKLNNYLKSKNINQQQNKDCTEVWQYLGLKIIKRRS